MGNGKQIKTKSDRLKEGISILKQLRDGGVKEHSLGYLDLKTKISEWVNSENSGEGTSEFSEYGPSCLTTVVQAYLSVTQTQVRED